MKTIATVGHLLYDHALHSVIVSLLVLKEISLVRPGKNIHNVSMAPTS